MSVKKFKVGDKVRVREELIGGRYYGGCYFGPEMSELVGKVFTINEVFWDNTRYTVKENSWFWVDEMLEPAEKTLENLEKGDLIECEDGKTKKVLVAIDGVYLLSAAYNHRNADLWYTIHEMEEREWKLIQPEEPATETIEIGGKKYNKQEFEEAVKDLEPIEQ